MRAISRFVSGLGPRQRKLALAALLCLTGVVAYFVVDDTSSTAVAEGLRNPMSVFAGRSPGARDAGALYQTKRRLAAGRQGRPSRVGPVPRERVLAQERTRPATAFLPNQLADAFPDALALGSADNLQAVPGVPRPGFGPGFDVPPFAFGDGPLAASTPEQPAGPQPAVPEIATWLMMIAGLGAAGIVLRRREQQARLPKSG